jgi:protocatechuate 3,4-dioxygenase alpha subunit
MMLTPSQTIGPFFSHALPWPEGPHVVPADHPGAFWLRGRVFDGTGAPVPDALVESWQTDPAGIRGFGRCPTDEHGRYAIRTVKPGPVPGPGGVPQAPHLALSIFARGLLNRVVTRVYFADEASANAADPVLVLMDEGQRATLVAGQTVDGYAFDIWLQGEHETVFFSV